MLSGSVARRDENCSALMALGLVIGREKIEDTAAYNNAMNASQNLADRFKRRNCKSRLDSKKS